MKNLLLIKGLAAFALALFGCGSPDDTVWTDDGTENGTDYCSIWMEETTLKGGHTYTIYADAALPQMECTATLDAEKNLAFNGVLKALCKRCCDINKKSEIKKI